jgi:hypothetical protein
VPLEAVSPGVVSTVDRVDAGGRVEECPVQLGLETPFYDEILSGLSEGDLVVIGSRAGLRPGVRVVPRRIGSIALSEPAR